MKSSTLRTLVVTLGLGATFGPVALMAQGAIRATIPFDFTVGAKSFAAGEYTVQQLKGTLFVIRNIHDRSGALTNAMPPEDTSTTKAGMAVLTFTRYGDSYFLSKVSDGRQNWGLYPSAAEKVLIAKRASPKPVAVATALPSK